MSAFSEILDSSTANAFIAEQRVNSISAEVETIIFAMADVTKKVDEIMTARFWETLDQETKMTLLCIKADMLKTGNELIEANKKL